MKVKETSPAIIKQVKADAEQYFAAAKEYDDLTTQGRAGPMPRSYCAGRNCHEGNQEQAHSAGLPATSGRHARGTRAGREKFRRCSRESGSDVRQAISGLGHEGPGREACRAKDYRGKIVVLDFWSRGCDWCIRALPQIGQVADDLKAEPVVVLGLALDGKVEDSRLVVEKLGIHYPVLQARDVREVPLAWLSDAGHPRS